MQRIWVECQELRQWYFQQNQLVSQEKYLQEPLNV